MIVQKIHCDCCKREITEKGWEHIPEPFYISLTTDCQNPLGYLEENPGF